MIPTLIISVSRHFNAIDGERSIRRHAMKTFVSMAATKITSRAGYDGLTGAPANLQFIQVGRLNLPDASEVQAN